MKLYGLDYDHESVIPLKRATCQGQPDRPCACLALPDGEIVVDSAIIDHLDEWVGPDSALTPLAGPERRKVLKWHRGRAWHHG